MSDPERPGAERWVPPEATLGALRDAVDSCRGCELHENATQAVFSAGRASATMMLVGEQPGDREDEEGKPFVGPAGRVLADAVDAAGIRREDLYLTNAVKHFRFTQRGKRRIHDKPAVAHIVACHPWLDAEMRAVKPRVIVCLGATAARAVLGRTVKIGQQRGVPIVDVGLPAVVIVTAHPSAVLRMRESGQREEAFDALVADLEVAREAPVAES